MTIQLAPIDQDTFERQLELWDHNSVVPLRPTSVSRWRAITSGGGHAADGGTSLPIGARRHQRRLVGGLATLVIRENARGQAGYPLVG